MNLDTLLPSQPHVQLVSPKLAIDSIGRDCFFDELLNLLNEICGADHCAAYELSDTFVGGLGNSSLDGSQTACNRFSRYLGLGYWRHDPVISEMQRTVDRTKPSISRIDLAALPADIHNDFYPDIHDRVILYGQRRDSVLYVNVLRSANRERFSSSGIAGLLNMGDALISLVSKHTEMQKRLPHLALASLAAIERSMLAHGKLSKREAQVCARILYGLSSAGIALDLGIGEETVKTYRNRAYLRLEIGSVRELLSWYLLIWGSANEHVPKP